MRELTAAQDFGRLVEMLSPAASWISERLLAPALVAIIFTGFTTYIIERHRGRRDALSKLLEQAREDSRLLQAFAIEYWSHNYQDEDDVLEAKIIVMEQDFSRTIIFLNDGLQVLTQTSLDQRLDEIRDGLMGGDFQSRVRKKDPQRIRNFSKKISTLRIDMTRGRMRSLGRWLAGD